MNDTMEKQLVIVEDKSGDNTGKEHYWASCHFCPNEICVYESPDTAGQERAEYIMEFEYDWLFADGTWICPVCQTMKEENTYD